MEQPLKSAAETFQRTLWMSMSMTGDTTGTYVFLTEPVLY